MQKDIILSHKVRSLYMNFVESERISKVGLLQFITAIDYLTCLAELKFILNEKI